MSLKQIPKLEDTGMQEEGKVEKDNGLTLIPSSIKQQRLEIFLKRPSKE